jgi:hypothetical protein
MDILERDPLGLDAVGETLLKHLFATSKRTIDKFLTDRLSDKYLDDERDIDINLRKEERSAAAKQLVAERAANAKRLEDERAAAAKRLDDEKAAATQRHEAEMAATLERLRKEMAAAQAQLMEKEKAVIDSRHKEMAAELERLEDERAAAAKRLEDEKAAADKRAIDSAKAATERKEVFRKAQADAEQAQLTAARLLEVAEKAARAMETGEPMEGLVTGKILFPATPGKKPDTVPPLTPGVMSMLDLEGDTNVPGTPSGLTRQEREEQINKERTSLYGPKFAALLSTH